MMDNAEGFLTIWYTAMAVGAIVMITLAIIVYLIYKLLVSTKTDPKEKYD
jgi:hypothetical protein